MNTQVEVVDSIINKNYTNFDNNTDNNNNNTNNNDNNNFNK